MGPDGIISKNFRIRKKDYTESHNDLIQSIRGSFLDVTETSKHFLLPLSYIYSSFLIFDI